MSNQSTIPRGGGNNKEPETNNYAGVIASGTTVEGEGRPMEVKGEFEANTGLVKMEGGEGSSDMMGVRGGSQKKSVRGGVKTAHSQREARTVEESNRLIALCSAKLGSLRALSAFFMKMQRLGVGTTRAEKMAADITWQNILRSEREVLKERGKPGQEKDERTVRIVMRAMLESIDINIVSLKRWSEKLITDRVVMEEKMVRGGRHKKLQLVVRKLSEKEYKRKWSQELEEKGRYLTLKYGKVRPVKDCEIISGVKYRDTDLGKREPENYRDNVVVMGDIVPPLNDNEYAYLGLGPKHRLNGRITTEEVEISCEEAKVKLLWEISNNVMGTTDDGTEEEEIDEEMRRRMKEEDNERRITWPQGSSTSAS